MVKEQLLLRVSIIEFNCDGMSDTIFKIFEGLIIPSFWILNLTFQILWNPKKPMDFSLPDKASRDNPNV